MKILRSIPCPIHWVYDSGSVKRFQRHDFLLSLDKNLEYTDKFEEADIIPLLPPTEIDNLTDTTIRLQDHQTAFIMHFYAIDDHMDMLYYHRLLDVFKILAKNRILGHKNIRYKDSDGHKIFYYDSMFNTCKLYFTEYEKYNLEDKIWSLGSDKNTYRLPPINKTATKKFINASYIYPPYTHPRMKYRKALKDELTFYKNYGFIGIPEARLLPNDPTPLMLEKISENLIQWYPIADSYYEQSYLSIVIETIIGKESGPILVNGCVTEKTFEPLAKGNYILPFGYKGLINDILDYGFKLPDWIDYSYDDISNNESRFKNYLNSIKNVIGKPLRVLNDYYKKDKEMIEYNRQVFFNRPYDELHSKIVKAVI